nr:hypothetical protein [uncultured Albidiferax sp.]
MVEGKVVPRPAVSIPAVNTTSELIRQGHLVPTNEFRQLMGWGTEQTLKRALAARRLFALLVGNEFYFPRFFADASLDRKHLEAVTKQLGDLPGGAKLQFFIARKGSLNGKSVLEAVAAGQLELVLRLASAYAEA